MSPSASAPLKPEDLLEYIDVSRETLDRLRLYADLLLRWQQRMNLVGPETLTDLWRRHFLDSAQLAVYLEPHHRIITDLGSGAGFPGLVLAVITGLETHLVESNSRKAAFLREAARQCEAPAIVHAERIEAVQPWPTDVITARALAPLSRLLEMSARFSTAGDNNSPTCFFLKGESASAELTEAKKGWNMRATLAGSVTNPMGHVLRIDWFETCGRDS